MRRMRAQEAGTSINDAPSYRLDSHYLESLPLHESSSQGSSVLSRLSKSALPTRNAHRHLELIALAWKREDGGLTGNCWSYALATAAQEAEDREND